jgi:tRNA pseudouridine32 synthase/23S rRNA pseudouridine746 synthase
MLPPRDGVGASQVALPAGTWRHVLEFLVARFPAIDANEWCARMARGEVVDAAGGRVTPEMAYRPHSRLFYYRQVPGEAAPTEAARVVFEDELLVVADKPHGVPVTPSGGYLQQALLVQLRRELGLDLLVPLHRIDRETAGLVLFAKQPATRAAYVRLFADRAVTKVYEALAPRTAELSFPFTRASRIVESRHFMQMREEEPAVPPTRAPNAFTRIDQVEIQGSLARYRLWPLTGKRHQLRVHMAALGLPIVGDRIYPLLLPKGSDDRRDPLRLLAQHIAFVDPVTGQERRFSTRQALHYPAA